MEQSRQFKTVHQHRIVDICVFRSQRDLFGLGRINETSHFSFACLFFAFWMIQEI